MGVAAKRMGIVAVMMWLAFLCLHVAAGQGQRRRLRFDGRRGEFRILQVADMHFGDGRKTLCEDVFPQQMNTCSDLNTTAFIRRLILAEKPDFIVFTGDNIFGIDATDAAASMNAAFAPAISSGIPWAAVLGNHDQESTFFFFDKEENEKLPSPPTVGPSIGRDVNRGMCPSSSHLWERANRILTPGQILNICPTRGSNLRRRGIKPTSPQALPLSCAPGGDQESTLSREGVMKHIAGMKNTLSWVNPSEARVIDGFGNYNLEVHGIKGSHLANKSLLNLYFLDSGDYSTVSSVPGYAWIKPSQQLWFQHTSFKLQRSYINTPVPQKTPAPGLAYFHIPLPEYASFDSSNYTGGKQEGISSASVNSGFFTTMVAAGDVKAVFTGHDHLNDFCGKLTGINLCCAGGFGYHAYGKAGWARRSRMVIASLEKTKKGSWGTVESIKTWKRLDDGHLTAIDRQVLWKKS